MTRRTVGLMLLAAVLVVVAVVADVRPHRLAGVARPQSVPGAPAIGDCVLDPLVPPSGDTLPAGLQVGDTVAPTYPAQRMGPCTGARYGEVVAVVVSPRAEVVHDAGGGDTYLDDLNLRDCGRLEAAYLGFGSTADGWVPTVSTTAAMAGPSTLQRAAGQRWAVCIVAPEFAQGSSGPSAAQPYTSPIRNALRTGRERDVLGTCQDGPPVDVAWNLLRCARPHSFEMLAAGDSGPQVIPRASLQQSCERAVGEITGMPDATAGGALTARISVVFGSGTIVTGSPIPAESYVTCGIAPSGTRKLAGSLIALGRQPIPWA